jgi:hypothetical protein
MNRRAAPGMNRVARWLATTAFAWVALPAAASGDLGFLLKMEDRRKKGAGPYAWYEKALSYGADAELARRHMQRYDVALNRRELL